MKFAVFQILDSYVLSNFLFYFFLTLACFVTMIQVFTFFDLLSDIVKNNIPMSHVVRYHLFLTPELIYDTLPIAVLVSILATFGVMTKHNEVTAFKASGVSLYRLAAPVLSVSVLLSAGLFAFDYYYVAQANRRQDALRDKMKDYWQGREIDDPRGPMYRPRGQRSKFFGYHKEAEQDETWNFWYSRYDMNPCGTNPPPKLSSANSAASCRTTDRERLRRLPFDSTLGSSTADEMRSAKGSASPAAIG